MSYLIQWRLLIQQCFVLFPGTLLAAPNQGKKNDEQHCRKINGFRSSAEGVPLGGPPSGQCANRRATFSICEENRAGATKKRFRYPAPGTRSITALLSL